MRFLSNAQLKMLGRIDRGFASLTSLNKSTLKVLNKLGFVTNVDDLWLLTPAGACVWADEACELSRYQAARLRGGGRIRVTETRKLVRWGMLSCHGHLTSIGRRVLRRGLVKP